MSSQSALTMTKITGGGHLWVFVCMDGEWMRESERRRWQGFSLQRQARAQRRLKRTRNQRASGGRQHTGVPHMYVCVCVRVLMIVCCRSPSIFTTVSPDASVGSSCSSCFVCDSFTFSMEVLCVLTFTGGTTFEELFTVYSILFFFAQTTLLPLLALSVQLLLLLPFTLQWWKTH